MHAVSDRITDELIAVYGLLDSFLKSESDSKKKKGRFAACHARFAILKSNPTFPCNMFSVMLWRTCT